jgi:hypothetical protein
MPLYITTLEGLVTGPVLPPEYAEGNLFSIVHCDTGLGDESVNDPTLRLITYNRKKSGAGPDRVAAMVGLPHDIIITGVNWDAYIGDVPIENFGGGVTLDKVDNKINIIYDASHGLAAGYVVLDASGNDISFPGPILLFHELAHAYHISVGDIPRRADGSIDKKPAQAQAIRDENRLRSEVGLTLRDPNNDEGEPSSIGFDPPYPNCPEPWGLGKLCFIVGAALESQEAEGVTHLREARDAWRVHSPLGDLFTAELMEEYHRFGPVVAAAMLLNPGLMNRIRVWLVEPLTHHRELIDAYVISRGRAEIFLQKLGPVLRDFHTKNGQDPAPKALWRAAEWLSLRLRGNGSTAAEAMPDPEIREIFEYLADVVTTCVGVPARMTAWAAGALAQYWAAVFHSDNSQEIPQKFATRFETWLAQAPVPQGFTCLPITVLAEELQFLAEHVFVTSTVRASIEAALIEAASAAERPTVCEALRAVGWRTED